MSKPETTTDLFFKLMDLNGEIDDALDLLNKQLSDPKNDDNINNYINKEIRLMEKQSQLIDDEVLELLMEISVGELDDIIKKCKPDLPDVIDGLLDIRITKSQ